MRRIAVITGSRADYGLLRPVISKIDEDTKLELQLMVTGSHLSGKHGMTVSEINADGFKIAAKVRLPLKNDDARGTADAIAAAVKGFASAYSRLKPDIVLVLGDRFEIFGAAAAAVPFGIPVAHIHGGESTLGAFDDQLRHAITKMSSLHFPATSAYAAKIKSMGEDPRRIYCTGSPAVDNIISTGYYGREELLRSLGISGVKDIGIVTVHPVTLKKDGGLRDAAAMFSAIRRFKGIFWVVTMPNADPGNGALRKMIKKFVKDDPGQAKAFDSLGSARYLSLMKYASVMAGNSSSAIIEAPSFRLPAVNVGSRQEGRARGKNVIDVPICTTAAVTKALERAMSREFRRSLSGSRNPYGDGRAASRIAGALRTAKTKIK